MTAKHRAPQPKRRRSTDDIEKRLRRIERNYMREVVKVATHIARHEVTHALSRHALAMHNSAPEKVCCGPGNRPNPII